jgi:hypothetical protein
MRIMFDAISVTNGTHFIWHKDYMNQCFGLILEIA